MQAGTRRSGVLVVLGVLALLSLPPAVLGLGQIGRTLISQLAGPAEGIDFITYYAAGRLFLEDPSRLYDPVAGEALQRELRGGRPDIYLQFWNPPHAALLASPLALLPHGLAYAVGAGIGVLCIVAAAILLAPPSRERLLWPLASLLFLPVQLTLVLGQTSLLMLLGFALLVRVLLARSIGRSAGSIGLAVALLPWSLKPQLLPAFVIALALARRWGGLLGAAVLGALLTSLAVARVGGEPVAAFLLQGGEKTARVLSRDDTAGQTLLGLAQSLVGPGAWAGLLALAAGSGVLALVSWSWRSGPRYGSAALARLATLPIAAVLVAPHSLAYGLAPWVASGWLLVIYARQVTGPGADAALALLALGWATGNLAVMTEWASGFEWGALGGVVLLVGLTWLAEVTPDPAAHHPPAAPERQDAQQEVVVKGIRHHRQRS